MKHYFIHLLIQFSIHSTHVNSFIRYSIPQMKTASHFAAWSSALLAHEEYRKNLVAAGNLLDSKSMSAQTKSSSKLKPGSTHGVGLSDGINNWVDKTRRTIVTIKKGQSSLRN